MLELLHEHEPEELKRFRATLVEIDGDSWEQFRNHDRGVSYRALVQILHVEQRGMCGYCEKEINELRHVDHILPRKGDHAEPVFCLTYTNLILSCTSSNPRSCGNSKKANLLPIEPRSGTADLFWLSLTTGILRPAEGVSREQKRDINATLSILNLNNANLTYQRAQRAKDIFTRFEKIGEKSKDRAIDFLKMECASGSFQNLMSRTFRKQLDSPQKEKKASATSAENTEPQDTGESQSVN